MIAAVRSAADYGPLTRCLRLMRAAAVRAPMEVTAWSRAGLQRRGRTARDVRAGQFVTSAGDISRRPRGPEVLWLPAAAILRRSEERRVGRECRSGRETAKEKEKRGE